MSVKTMKRDIFFSLFAFLFCSCFVGWAFHRTGCPSTKQDLAILQSLRDSAPAGSSDLGIDSTQVGDVKHISSDWRQHFAEQLNGNGLEIGALHSQMPLHKGMNVTYVDRMSVPDLRLQYPELRAKQLLDPDIIADAEILNGISNSTYDFLVASHVVEHMRNPLLALSNWLRVLKAGGIMYVAVPDMRLTFDRDRSLTPFSHLLLDFLKPSLERDFEHFLQFAISVDKVGTAASVSRANRLVEINYSIHFHTFVAGSVSKCLSWLNENGAPLRIIEGPIQSLNSHEFHFLVQKA
jgi:SAM-dependent methyltransferase